MSIMIAEVYKALVEAGASEDSARAAAGAIPIAKDLATKEGLTDARAALTHDIADLRAEVTHDITDLRAEVKQDITDLRAEVKQDIADLRAEVKQDIADLRAEVKQDIADLRAEVKQDIASVKQETADLKSDLKIMKFVYGPAVLLMLAKLVFFP